MGIEERVNTPQKQSISLAKKCLYGAGFFVIGGNLVAIGADIIGDNIYSTIDYEGLVKANLTLAAIGVGIPALFEIGEKINNYCKYITTYLVYKNTSKKK